MDDKWTKETKKLQEKTICDCGEKAEYILFDINKDYKPIDSVCNKCGVSLTENSVN